MRLYPLLARNRIGAQPQPHQPWAVATPCQLTDQLRPRTYGFLAGYRPAAVSGLALALMLTSTPVRAFHGGQEPAPAQPTTNTPQAPAEPISTIPPQDAPAPEQQVTPPSTAPRSVTAAPAHSPRPTTRPLAPEPQQSVQKTPDPVPTPTAVPRGTTSELETPGKPGHRRPPLGMLITGLTTFVLGYTACTVSGLRALQRSKLPPNTDEAYIPAIERKFGARMLVPIIGPLAAPQFGRDIGASIFAVFAGATQMAGLSLALLGSIKYSTSKREHERQAERRRLSVFATPAGAGVRGQF